MLEEIIEAARQAGKIMLEAEKASIDVKEKTGSANFVTQYDMAVQENLRQALQRICPEADFLGEEGNDRPEQTALVFIVDPIDGTTNFIPWIPAQRHFHCLGAEREDRVWRGI